MKTNGDQTLKSERGREFQSDLEIAYVILRGDFDLLLIGVVDHQSRCRISKSFRETMLFKVHVMCYGYEIPLEPSNLDLIFGLRIRGSD